MISLLVLVLLLNIATQLITTLGTKQINTLLWTLYTSIPSTTSQKTQQVTAMRKEIVQLRRELTATSSQDEFARWAKLKRGLDKKQEEFEKLNASVNATRVAFESQAGALRWVLTSGFRLGLQFWYTKQPMFWLPQGWMPGYVEWMLAFPRAPTGSVSIQVWSFATSQIVGMVFAVVAAFMNGSAGGKQNTPMTTPPAESAEGKKTK